MIFIWVASFGAILQQPLRRTLVLNNKISKTFNSGACCLKRKGRKTLMPIAQLGQNVKECDARMQLVVMWPGTNKLFVFCPISFVVIIQFNLLSYVFRYKILNGFFSLNKFPDHSC